MVTFHWDLPGYKSKVAGNDHWDIRPCRMRRKRQDNTKRRKLFFYHDMQSLYSSYIILVCLITGISLKA
jgi:hypothetical protein